MGDGSGSTCPALRSSGCFSTLVCFAETDCAVTIIITAVIIISDTITTINMITTAFAIISSGHNCSSSCVCRCNLQRPKHDVARCGCQHDASAAEAPR